VLQGSSTNSLQSRRAARALRQCCGAWPGCPISAGADCGNYRAAGAAAADHPVLSRL